MEQDLPYGWKVAKDGAGDEGRKRAAARILKHVVGKETKPDQWTVVSNVVVVAEKTIETIVKISLGYEESDLDMEQRAVLGEVGLFFSSEGWCPLDDGDGDSLLLETSLGGSQRDLHEIHHIGERRVE